MAKNNADKINISENSDSSEQNKNKKSKTKRNEESKATVIKCVALVLGSVLVISTFSKCLGKISGTNKEITEGINGTGSDVELFEQDDPFSQAFSGDGEDIQTASTSATAEEQAAPDSENGTEKESSAKETESQKKETDINKSPSVNKVPSTKEEIVEYFNTAINKVKPNAKSITFTNDESYQAGGIDLASLGAFESMIDSLIKSFMGPNKDKIGLVATSQEDKNKYFPVENESWASKLTAADVKEAKIAKKDGVYTIGIKVYDDALSDNPTNGSNHHTRVFSVVKAGDINQNAGPAKSLLSGLKTGYKNGTIICKIDAETGNVLSVSYDYVWILHVDSFGGVDAPFGGRQSFDIKW